MSERNEMKQNVFGDVYIETKDKNGNVIQTSKRKENVFTGEYYDTYDASGNYIGHSEPSTDAFGNRYIKTFDQNDNLLRTSSEKIDINGNPFWEIRDSSGEIVGVNRNGETNYYKKQETPSGTDGSSHSGGAILAGGGNFAGIMGVVILFLALLLNDMLQDPDGREIIHRITTIGLTIAPIVFFSYQLFKGKTTQDPYKIKTLVFSSAAALFMLLFFIFTTVPSMAWVEDKLIIYFAYWMLPYVILAVYYFIAAKMDAGMSKQTKAMVGDLVSRNQNFLAVYYFVCDTLMILRWEFYADSVKYMRVLVESITVFVIGAIGVGATSLAYYKVYIKVLESSSKLR